MNLYRKRPNLTIGFHGCDESVRNSLVNNPNSVKKSQESYDWLGNGFYVWENNYKRAIQWAKDKKKRGTLNKPSVVGVIYLLEHCLDFTDSEFIELLPIYYQLLKSDLKLSGKSLPANKDLPTDRYHDLIIRELDCAVIEYLHQKMDEKIEEETSTAGFSDLIPFDTVRGIFTEGGPAFDGAGIQTKNHIQVCIRNLDCIKGFFIPRESSRFA
jgi:hypothetical protein